MDVYVEEPQVVEPPAPWAWPEGALSCRAKLTVQHGRVTDIAAPDCAPALASEIERVRGLGFVADDRVRIVQAVLTPPRAGELALTRLEAPTVTPRPWDPGTPSLPVEPGTRCLVDLVIGAGAEVSVDPSCPEPLATHIAKQARLAEWLVSGQAPAGGVRVHARVALQWAPDVSRRGRNTLHVESALPRPRDPPIVDLSPNTTVRLRLTVAPDGTVSGVIFEECPPALKAGVERTARSWTFWPAYVDGVAVAAETTVVLRSR